MLLTLSTRAHYETLFDARTLADADDRPAIIYLETGCEPITLTRAAFRQAAERYADALRRLDVLPRDLVIIAHTQNLESIFAFWGAMLAGAIPSMFPTLTEKLDPDIYRRSMAELVSHSGARAVLTTDAFAPTLAEVVPCAVYGSLLKEPLTPHPSPTRGEGNKTGAPSHSPAQNLSVENSNLPKTNSDSPSPRQWARGLGGEGSAPDTIAFLQHSSGTTGLQKGVALSHRAALNQLASYADAIALREDDVIVSWLPLYHDMGLIAGFLMPLVQGIPLVLMSPFDWVKHPAMLFRAIHDYRGTLCWLPNFAYNHCARRIRQRDIEGISLARMRMFINCSEPVRHDSHQLFAERFAANGVTLDKLAVSYAMAENTFAVTQTPPGQPARLDTVDAHELAANQRALPCPADQPNATVKVSCGPTITGCECRAVDAEGNPLPERHVGELAVRSDSMLSGYYQRPDLQPFTPDGWYRTGDMGYLADGEVYVVGRSKDLIINAGKNVYPQDIEAIVNTVQGVHAGRAVAFGVPDEREGTELIAVVAEIDTSDDDERQRITHDIRQSVARASTVTVTFVELVDEKWLIKTSSGKIARAANREKWLAGRDNEG
jgi:acyl-CoA synthetase (AMP-forming)/AMP-acid ligase II